MSEIPIFFKGDLMLLRWAENDTSGRTVTFQLDESTIVHPFKGQRKGATNGQRYKAVLVAINESEEPVNTRAPVIDQRTQPEGPRQDNESLPVHKGKRFSELKRSAQAALKCQDAEFQFWLDISGDQTPESREADANRKIKLLLGIQSKKELDTDRVAASRWDGMLADFDYRNQLR